MRKARHHDRHARASDQHLELITGGKRRRARSAREKAAIVAEAFAPGANVAKIRRHHGLLFSWRRQVRRARPSPVAEATAEEAQDPVFVPVEIEGPVGSPAGSIIADPRREEIRDRVNTAIKYRDWWRPFAPSMLAEAADDYLEGAFHAPVMIVNWTNEEGSRFAPAMLASGVYAGVFTQDYAYAREDREGRKFGDELARIGYRGSEPVGSIKFQAMFELHIDHAPTDRASLDRALALATEGVTAAGWDVMASMDSPVTGAKGAQELLVHARRPARGG